MKQPRPSLLGVLVIGALLCVAFAGLGSLLNSVYAANSTVHEIRGTVQSVTPGDTPPVVVIRGLHGHKEEIVVGAMVQARCHRSAWEKKDWSRSDSCGR